MSKDLSAVFVCRKCDCLYTMDTKGFSHDACMFCSDDKLYLQVIPHGLMFKAPQILLYYAQHEDTNVKTIVMRWVVKPEEKQLIYSLKKD